MGGGIAMNFLNVGVPVTLVERNSEALDRGIGVIRRNYENTAKKGRMTNEQVEQRIAHALLRLVRQSGRKTEQGIEVDFPITRQDIAEMTGTTLHTVSRLLSRWEDKGIVRGGRQKVTVVDPHGLMLIAENRKD